MDLPSHTTRAYPRLIARTERVACNGWLENIALWTKRAKEHRFHGFGSHYGRCHGGYLWLLMSGTLLTRGATGSLKELKHPESEVDAVSGERSGGRKKEETSGMGDGPTPLSGQEES